MSGPAGWDGILDPGEDILWQGRPDPGFAVPPGGLIKALFGAVFTGASVVWMMMAAHAPGPFWMVGLIFFFAGLGIIGDALVMPTIRRRNTWYTLTGSRAFIARRLLLRGRRLDSYPIGPDTKLTLVDGALGSVHFAAPTRRSETRTGTVPVGFERIPDAREVYALMRQIQRPDTTSSERTA